MSDDLVLRRRMRILREILADPDCAIDDCMKPSRKRGWCHMHYWRWKHHGDPLVRDAGRVSNAEVLRHLVGIATDECVLWPLGTSVGYGSVQVDGRTRHAHRVACEWAHGLAPTGMEAAHTCGERLCVNQRHVRWATSVENEADKLLHGRDNRGERCGTNVLSVEQVLDIRRRWPAELQRVLAAEYGVKQQTISEIVTRRNWAWLQ